MIARSSFWRVMAWIGAGLCGKLVAGGAGSGGWQDESGASRWGVEAQNCEDSRASRYTPRLAPLAATRAFLPRDEPAACRLPVQP